MGLGWLLSTAEYLLIASEMSYSHSKHY